MKKILLLTIIGMLISFKICLANTIVHLYDHTLVEGDLIELTPDYIKLKVFGLPETYYSAEVAYVRITAFDQAESSIMQKVKLLGPQTDNEYLHYLSSLNAERFQDIQETLKKTRELLLILKGGKRLSADKIRTTIEELRAIHQSL